MKNIYYILLILFVFNLGSSNVYAQKFNGYKYIIFEDLIYESGSVDEYEIAESLMKFFKKKKFKIVRMDEDGEIYDGRPKGGVENICEILVADIREEDVDFNQYNYARATVYVDFYDCNDKKLSFSGGPTKLARYTIKGAIKASTKELLENIESRMGKYKFDSSRTPPEN